MPKDTNNQNIQALQLEELRNVGMSFNYIVGVIAKVDMQRFKRLIFRVAKGNAWSQFAEIDQNLLFQEQNLLDTSMVSHFIFSLSAVFLLWPFASRLPWEIPISPYTRAHATHTPRTRDAPAPPWNRGRAGGFWLAFSPSSHAPCSAYATKIRHNQKRRQFSSSSTLAATWTF